MKKFIQVRAEWILLGAGILIMAAIIWFLVWGVTNLAQDIGTSLSNPPSSRSSQSFNLDSASKLNLRGLNEE